MDGEEGVATKCEQREESPAAAYHRLKRDEWSEGAVGSLLDAYEEKWSMRNRAKLKGHDWEEVAKHVSARVNHTKGPKTSTQCKNKIESMKKRYRSEVAASDATSWPLFPRLDLMLRGGAGAAASCHLLQQPLLQQLGQAPPPPATAPSLLPSPSLDQPDGVMNIAKLEEAREEKKERCNAEGEDEEEVAPQETESITLPKCNTGEERTSEPISRRKMKKTRKRRRGDDECREVGESVRWLAEVMLRSEQARADAMKEVEKIRAEVEEQKAQMELKRTEIIANTQLQIARLLVGKAEKANTNSSFPHPLAKK